MPEPRREEQKRDVILRVAQGLFESGQSVSVRKIAEKAGVADGLLTHHFGSYAGLVAELTAILNKREAKELKNFQANAGSSPLEIALDFFRRLAEQDLHPKNRRVRRMSCRMSWDWSMSDESKLAGSITELLKPLWNALIPVLLPVLQIYVKEDDLVMTLWAIYLLPLRLALSNTLLPPSVVDTTENLVDAIIKDIEPKFSLILGQKNLGA